MKVGNVFSLQAKAQEELEKEQYRKFLAKFTAENFLKKVVQIIISIFTILNYNPKGCPLVLPGEN